MRFTAVFHDSDGRITSVQRNATANVIRGRSYVQADFSGDPDDFYVSGGEVIPKGEKPSSAHFFDYSSASWTLDLNEAKDQAWEEIKRNRENQEYGTHSELSTFPISCQSRIMSAIQRAQLDRLLPWCESRTTLRSVSMPPN